MQRRAARPSRSSVDRSPALRYGRKTCGTFLAGDAAWESRAHPRAMIHWQTYPPASEPAMRAIFLWVLLLPAILCGEELAPWKSNRHPADVPKRHVAEVAAGRQEYNVVQGGTM